MLPTAEDQRCSPRAVQNRTLLLKATGLAARFMR
jgi:hypothetical protein